MIFLLHRSPKVLIHSGDALQTEVRPRYAYTGRLLGRDQRLHFAKGKTLPILLGIDLQRVVRQL